MNNLNFVLHRLAQVTGHTPQRSGHEYRACCPVHEADGQSHTPSLSVREGDRGILFKCHAGCKYRDIMIALGLDVKPRAKSNIVAEYDYRDEHGHLLFQKVRLEPKNFRFRHLPPQGDWVWKKPALAEYPLYRLRDVMAAKAHDRPILIVEGEKDADRLAGPFMVATTNVEGASEPGKKPKWRKEYTAQLSGAARVILLPDNDPPGRAHMAAIAQTLRGKVGEVRIVELPGLPEKGDVSDWLNQGHTIDELIALVEQAPAPGQEADPAVADPPVVKESAPADEVLRLRRGSDIKPMPIAWLWPGWLAAGKLHVMAGPSGVGKTTIALAMAATLTSGGRWPSGEPAKPTNVVIWSGEDDPADTLVPRLIACGADMNRVFFVDGIFTSGKKRAFDPANDIDLLHTQIQRVGNVGMAIIDPLVSAVAGDSHKNSEVRRALQPLVDLAQSTRAAMVGISHFAKSSNGRDPVERVVGSLAFGALARIVMAAAKLSEEQGGGGMLIRTKSNIGRDNDGYRYAIRLCELPDHPDIGETAYCEWGEAIKGDARTLLDSAEATTDPEERSEREEAREFLLTVLADGPVSTKQIKREADENGYAWRTVRRAQQDLCIIPAKSGMKGEWRWQLPPKMSKTAEDVQNVHVGKVGHLRESWTSSAAQTDVLTLVDHLRNGGSGHDSLTLQKALHWDETRWRNTKDDALQQKRIYCQAGAWYATAENVTDDVTIAAMHPR